MISSTVIAMGTTGTVVAEPLNASERPKPKTIRWRPLVHWDRVGAGVGVGVGVGRHGGR